MADAIRLISVRRGYDPREFALVCFGGAGPLHGAALARELSIPTVLVPPNPGTTSALGCLLVDVRHDLFTLLLGTVDDVDPDEVEEAFAELEEGAGERMRAEGVPEGSGPAPADDRHALRGPVALHRGAGGRSGQVARRTGRDLRGRA
jgi:N-methylhydantoinase A